MILGRRKSSWTMILLLILGVPVLGALWPAGSEASEAQGENKEKPELPEGVQMIWRQYILTQMTQEQQDLIDVVQKIRGNDQNRVIVVERSFKNLSEEEMSHMTERQKREAEVEAREYFGGWLNQSIEFMTQAGSQQNRAVVEFAKTYNLKTRRDLMIVAGIEEIRVRYPELEVKFTIPVSTEVVTERRISTGTLLDNAVEKVYPTYPEKARSAGVQGSVQVEIVVDENGDVASAKVVEGDPLLHSAVLDAVRQWKFEPFLFRGKPGKVSGKLIFVLTP